jgi:hypothetical protein
MERLKLCHALRLKFFFTCKDVPSGAKALISVRPLRPD